MKFILFTVIFVSSISYYIEIFAIHEIDGTLNNISDDNYNNYNKTAAAAASDIIFSNVINITNNTKDSVYAQIVANDNNVYVVWQESVRENGYGNNYDIYFKKSEDNGNTFGQAINLSNNIGFSEHPQIAQSKKGIFIVWADNTNSNNTEIMFAKSLDDGKTFSKPINLSNNLKNSNNQEISVFNENVYVVWQDVDDQNNNKQNSSIMFKSSIDSGNTFNDTIKLATNTNDAYPKVNSYGDNIYIVWNTEKSNSKSENDKHTEGLFFIKSADNGNNFGNINRIVLNNFGESQIAVNENKVFIVWGGLHEKNINDIYLVKSDDNGTSFTDPYTIQENITDLEVKNQSNKINHPTNVEITNNQPEYIVWQDKVSQKNQDIFITHVKNSFQTSQMLNLSNNSGISECPQIAIANNHIYVIWEDITPGNHEILFTYGTVHK
ncbi:MAG TPA: sialidase family protein [Nitrososphaeraceae archaeon]|nr:sialidase family protein [Nitrososphaeraceae archaeon]